MSFLSGQFRYQQQKFWFLWEISVFFCFFLSFILLGTAINSSFFFFRFILISFLLCLYRVILQNNQKWQTWCAAQFQNKTCLRRMKASAIFSHKWKNDKSTAIFIFWWRLNCHNCNKKTTTWWDLLALIGKSKTINFDF